MTVILCTRKSFRASEINSILNKFLYVMSSSLTRAVTTLITVCWHLKMFSQFFKTAHTVMLRKSNKVLYEDSDAWQPIALLNTLRKLMKELMTRQLLKTAKKHKLIAETQMRACIECFTETALDLLTEQIHTVWNSDKFIVTLLSLNISNAFNTVLTVQLLNILRKKEISGWTVRWIKTFLTDCMTSLVIQEQKTASFRVNNEVS